VSVRDWWRDVKGDIGERGGVCLMLFVSGGRGGMEELRRRKAS